MRNHERLRTIVCRPARARLSSGHGQGGGRGPHRAHRRPVLVTGRARRRLGRDVRAPVGRGAGRARPAERAGAQTAHPSDRGRAREVHLARRQGGRDRAHPGTAQPQDARGDPAVAARAQRPRRGRAPGAGRPAARCGRHHRGGLREAQVAVPGGALTLVRTGAPGGGQPLTDYERRVLQELHHWKHPPLTLRSRAADMIELGIDQIAARLPVGFLDQMIRRALPALNRVASMTAVAEFVLAAYRRKGHPHVRSLDDIAALSLEDVERVVGTKRFAEVVKGAGEGGLAGFYGAAGAALDVPALLALALRNVNVFAYSYGFGPTTDEGRAYALSVIDASAALGTKAKQVTPRGRRL